jgi:hypothetical protein
MTNGKTWKEANVAYFKLPSQQLPGNTKENHSQVSFRAEIWVWDFRIMK